LSANTITTSHLVSYVMLFQGAINSLKDTYHSPYNTVALFCVSIYLSPQDYKYFEVREYPIIYLLIPNAY
jgi:phosphatidylserine decarboxylase